MQGRNERTKEGRRKERRKVEEMRRRGKVGKNEEKQIEIQKSGRNQVNKITKKKE